MKTANCPACGAPVIFRSSASILAVCDYCKSTLIRHDLELENLGKMAELLEDASPLQRGAEGRYKSGHFAVVGRIQLKYEDGIWNEWHLLFDNMKTGWLSEASGSYVITFPSPAPASIPPFDDVKVGQNLSLLGENFEVSAKESATCIAGEGELPFKVGAGYPAPAIDLANERNFASIDYSETPPLLFVGEQVELAALRMTGLRDREAAAGKAKTKAFNCPSCAAPLEIHAKGTESVACGSCGSVIDAANDNHQILSRYNKKRTRDPVLALGSRGHLRGAEYDVVGFLCRQVKVDGVPYEWSEYLLYSEQEGFRWLSEYQGHWNFIRSTTRLPKAGGGTQSTVNFLGKAYRHFQTANASVTYVLGEFYWRVKVGESAVVTDYVAPPLMLSSERSDKETTWSLAEYVEPEEIATAFKLPAPLPATQGVYANQPSPHAGLAARYWKTFGAFAMGVLLIQTGFLMFSDNRVVFHQNLEFNRAAAEQAINTEVFEVSGRPSNLVVRNRTDLNNNWLYLDMNLVERDTGRSYQFGREISYYHGFDSDGSWSEGNARDEAVLSEVPAGQYFLQIDPELPADWNTHIGDQLEVVRDVPGWTNFWLTLAALLIFPVLAWWRGLSFETRRWAESDHAPSGGDDDSDSGD